MIYLNKLYNAIINYRHLTVFAFSYAYFPKISLLVIMWTVCLWLNMAIS